VKLLFLLAPKSQIPLPPPTPAPLNDKNSSWFNEPLLDEARLYIVYQYQP